MCHGHTSSLMAFSHCTTNICWRGKGVSTHMASVFYNAQHMPHVCYAHRHIDECVTDKVPQACEPARLMMCSRQHLASPYLTYFHCGHVCIHSSIIFCSATPRGQRSHNKLLETSRCMRVEFPDIAAATSGGTRVPPEKVCFTFKWIFTLLWFFRHYPQHVWRVFVFSKQHIVSMIFIVFILVFILKLFFDNMPAQEALCQPPSKCWPLPSSCGRVSLVLLQNHAPHWGQGLHRGEGLALRCCMSTLTWVPLQLDPLDVRIWMNVWHRLQFCLDFRKRLGMWCGVVVACSMWCGCGVVLSARCSHEVQYVHRMCIKHEFCWAKVH